MARITLPVVMTPLLANVAAPTAAPQGVTGAVTYTYVVVAVNENGKKALASAVGTTAVGNADLGSGNVDGSRNFNLVTWTDVAEAERYEIFRTVSGGTSSSLGKIGEAMQGVQSFDDNGKMGDGTTASAANGTAVAELSLIPYGDEDIDIDIKGTFTGTWSVTGIFSTGGAPVVIDATVTAPTVLGTTVRFAKLLFTNTLYTSGRPVAIVAGGQS